MCRPASRWSGSSSGARSWSGTRRPSRCSRSSASTIGWWGRWPAWCRSTGQGRSTKSPRPAREPSSSSSVRGKMAASFAQRESVLGELQIVRKIRETVRRWWGIELSFTDAKGFVVDHGKGILIPPSNRMCTACLGDRVGFQRCNESIEKAVARFGSDPAPARLLGPCHMGLEIVAAPISWGGERQGSLFACGFLVGEKAEAARGHAVETTQRLQLPVIQPAEAVDTIARVLHYNGPRKEKSFVATNCSALNDNLLESELFGHVKGAFTGAGRDKIGLFKVADGGTFFLDEVGDMSPAMQVKLLRVLQEGTFVPVGATKAERVDVRIIAATNRDLREMVARRQFREDLFYRLHVVNIEVPPLRQRVDDLPLLTGHFLQQAAQRTGRPAKKLHPDLLRSFYERRWPGNIRELENEIERLVVLSGETEVIPPEVGQHGRAAPQEGPIGRFAALVEQGLGSDLATAVCQLEKDLIALGLRETHGNKSRLAARLGVSRTTLIKKIREYGLEHTDPGRTNPGIEE